jgi:tetratricopeptide (TPR) repeat protein
VVLPPDTPFDRHLRAAQLSMQQGQYARAAESFSLAAGCNPKDVRPLVGRSHALFAAGQYLSSAVYLAKAIELDPRHVLAKPDRKPDFTEALGGPDLFLQRVTDLEKRAKAGGPPVLHLLLAYIYQQMDMPQEATTCLQAARKGLPSSRSVELLQAAIAGRVIQ